MPSCRTHTSISKRCAERPPSSVAVGGGVEGTSPSAPRGPRRRHLLLAPLAAAFTPALRAEPEKLRIGYQNMGLGASFSILVTAEMMGVKAGLGWYLTWAQGWASYTNMYGALIVMALLCSGLITLLFATRDRVLSWQTGTVKW